MCGLVGRPRCMLQSRGPNPGECGWLSLATSSTGHHAPSVFHLSRVLNGEAFPGYKHVRSKFFSIVRVMVSGGAGPGVMYTRLVRRLYDYNRLWVRVLIAALGAEGCPAFGIPRRRLGTEASNAFITIGRTIITSLHEREVLRT